MPIPISRFEDLVVWQKARDLTRAIYQATRQEAFARDFVLASQIQRAAISIMANIAACFECSAQAEFYHFLTIAQASCAEVRSQIYLAYDVEDLDLFSFEDLLLQAEEVARSIASLCSTDDRQREGKGRARNVAKAKSARTC